MNKVNLNEMVRNFQESRLSSRAQVDESSPVPMSTTNRSQMTHEKEIY